MRKRLRNLALGSSIALIVFICIFICINVVTFSLDSTWPRINRPDLVGNWVSNYEQANYKHSYINFPELQNGIHRLTLREDGKYEYEYVSFDGKEHGKNSNTWRFEYRLNGSKPYIVLSNFAFGPSKFQGKRASTGRSVTKWFGSIRITIKDDYGWYFRKENVQDSR